jgi:pimeloyl-ACP methyl ester carboxylesterase
VVGHSFGGRVGLCLAAERPELVKGLLLIGVPLLKSAPSRPALAYRVARRANRLGIYSDRRMELLRFRRGSADYRAAEGVMRDVLVRVVNESYDDELKSVRCPTSFLWGELDTAAPIEQARLASALVRKVVRFRTIPEVGHDVHLSHAAEMRSLGYELAEVDQ